MGTQPKAKDATMSKQQLVVAIIVSVVSLVFVVLHLSLPVVVALDVSTMALLGLAALPWLPLFVKSAEVTGLGKVETRDNKEQGTSPPLTPAGNTIVLSATTPLPPEAKKVLATLRRYQRAHFGADQTKRWTFAVQPLAPEYAAYLLGVAEAIKRGLVVVAPDLHQCMLTNDGLTFVEHAPELGDQADHYHF
jgi:hypothetical protein